MNLLKLFLLTVLFASGGAAIGGAIGMHLGRGGLVIGGLVSGLVLVAVGGLLAARFRWITRAQRLWCILGGMLGFILAWMVALATIMTPGALTASTVIVGIGAVLGAVVGTSPHEKA